MSNSKRIRRVPGRPPLLDDIVYEYRDTWLQPANESQVPIHVRVYEAKEGWVGWRLNDPAMVETTWLRALWKEVDDPLGPLERPRIASTEDDEETTLEVPTERVESPREGTGANDIGVSDRESSDVD